MNIHKNAKTTPKMRGLIVERRQAGETPRSIASAVGVSPATVRKWLRRHESEGVAGVQAFERISGAWRRQACPTVGHPLRRHRQESSGAGILVGLCAFALDDDPEPRQSRHRRHGLHAWDSVAGAASLAMDARKQSRAGIQAPARGHRSDLPDVRGRLPWHSSPGVSRLGPHLPSHAVVGLNLLDMARAVAAFDLPARIGQLFELFLEPISRASPSS